MKRRRLTREASTITNSTSANDEDYVLHTTTQKKAKGGKRKPRTSNVNVKAGTLRIPPAKPLVVNEDHSLEDRFSLSPLFNALGGELNGEENGEELDGGVPFEDILEDHLADIVEGRKRYLESTAERNQWNDILRSLAGPDKFAFVAKLEADQATEPSRFDALLERKLKLANLRSRRLSQGQITSPNLHTKVQESITPQPDSNSQVPAPDANVVNALESIGTTPFNSSFASRLLGSSENSENEFIFRDWEATSQWLDLMDDIHAFSALAHPERDQIDRHISPIDYQWLRPAHLPQLHDLLSRTFWPGINVADALQSSPERCTIVATYNHVVIGAALLSSPNETYITYLVVRSGWEGSRKMLYLLLQQAPHQDVILHVSANNPAMLLYNRFGFKAEEFIVGFYEEYLDRESRASKNAFRLRLRR